MMNIDINKKEISKKELIKLKKLQYGKGNEGLRKYIKYYKEVYGYDNIDKCGDDDELFFICLDNFNKSREGE